ncbi:MAG: hypothetical protein WCL51_08260 [Bacteroidota bacterium]
MKTKIIISAFLVVGFLVANVAKSQRNTTQIQERVSPQVQPMPTPPPTNYPVFNNDVKYIAPTQIQPPQITPQQYNSVPDGAFKSVTPTQVQSQTITSQPNNPVLNNGTKSGATTQEQPKPTSPLPFDSLLDGSHINSTSVQQIPLPPQPYNSLLDGAVIQGTPSKPKPINPPNITEEKTRSTHLHFIAKTDSTYNLNNKIIDIKTAVYFINESTSNTFYDVIWDDVLIFSIAPGQTSSVCYVIANAQHTLLFKVKNTNTIACSFNVPPLGNTSYNFTCSY